MRLYGKHSWLLDNACNFSKNITKISKQMLIFMSDVYSAVNFYSFSSVIIANDVISTSGNVVVDSFDGISVSGYNRQ